MPKQPNPVSRDEISTKVRGLVALADRYLTVASDYHSAVRQGKPTDTKPNKVKRDFYQEAKGSLEKTLAMALPSNVSTAVSGLQTFVGYSTSDKCDWEIQKIFELIADEYHDTIRKEMLDSISAQQSVRHDDAKRTFDSGEGGGVGTLER
ncbi:hypothetical protein HYY70_04025 [Candidatus Woesearchaeota archaeon]|nr:hypothetical protein [Candidatus Woesearchaeota archaeon]